MDVAERVDGGNQTAVGEHLFRAALDASVDGHTLWAPVLDEAGQLVDVECFYANPVAAAFAGRTNGALIGSRLMESARIAGNTTFADVLLGVVRTGVPLRHRGALHTRDSREVWTDFVIVRLGGGLSISSRDVTDEVALNRQLEKANADLARLAATDTLTNLPNRRAWNAALTLHLEQAAATHEPLVAALIDLDRFKMFNDAHGHLAGDEHLREVSARWRSALPLEATLARIGGEEFAVALPGMEPATAREFLARMCDLVPDNETCSAGLTVWDGAEDASSLLGRADAALYSAKHAGRNRVEALLPLR